tara:strand:+ start:397 stop:762 length:366 start_codon:yes stop_codon:yes gene_type:complete
MEELFIHNDDADDCVCVMCDDVIRSNGRHSKFISAMDRLNDKRCALGMWLLNAESRKRFVKRLYNLETRESTIEYIQEIYDLVVLVLESNDEWREYSGAMFRQIVRITNHASWAKEMRKGE